MANSYSPYVADGSTTIFNVTFSYITKAHVTVTLDNVASAFTWVDESRVQLSTAPANNVVVRVVRSTPSDAPIVDYVDGSIYGEADLDASALQSLYVSQEGADEAELALRLNFTNTEFDATAKKIINLANPTLPQDASTKYYIDTTMAGIKEEALASEVAAQSSEDDALISEVAAENSAAAALVSEGLADADKVQTALDRIATNDDLLLTNADVALTHADVVLAEANKVQTGLDRVATAAITNADVVLTHADVVLAEADKVQTGLDRIATAADKVTTNQDVVLTAASASNAAASLDSFTDSYLGVKASAPSTDNDGSALLIGTLYWNSTSDQMFAWTGSLWDHLAPTAANQAYINTVANIEANVTTVANSVTHVSNFANKYRIDGTAPTTSLDSGDLWWNTIANELRVYNGSSSTWAATAPTAANQAAIDIVAGDIVYAEDLGSIGVAVTTGSGNSITTVGNSISDVVTTAGIASEVVTTAGIAADITTTAGISSSIVTVSGIQGNVATVAGISSDVTTVAAKNTEIGLLGNAATVADLAILGTADVVTDLSILGTADVVSDLNTLGTADVVSDMNTLGTGGNVTNMDTLAGIAANITTVANVSSEITTLGTVAAVADMAILGTADVVADMNVLGTADVVADLNTLGTTAIVSDMNTLAAIASNVTSVAGNASNINAAVTNASNINSVVGLSTNINAVAGNATNVNTVASNSTNINLTAGSITNVNTVGGSIADVNRYANEYTISPSSPATPSLGDLWYDSTANTLKYHTGSLWTPIASGLASLSADTSPQLGGTLDGQNNNMINVGTISGSNIQLDFGGL